MDSNDEPDGHDESSRSLSDSELRQVSKVSPHLRAAIADWQQNRRKAGEEGAEREASSTAPLVRVTIELTRPDTAELEEAGVDFKHSFGVFYIANVRLDRLEALAELPTILRIHHSRETEPALDDSIPESRANTVRNPQYPFSGTDKFTGQGVIIGIIDSGINPLHPVFRLPNDQTKSRIRAIMDHRQTPRVTYTRAQIEAAIAANADLIQSGMIVGGNRVETSISDHKHGTHVAGIAAGNGKIAGNCNGEFTYVGVAPEAELVIVKHNYGDQDDLLEAIRFIEDTAAAVPPSGVPCVINISLGHSLGPHDGTDLMDKMIDDYLLLRSLFPDALPVVLVAAAGNEGGHQAANAFTFTKGEDSHAQGVVAPGGVEKRLRFKLPDVELDPVPGERYTRAEIRYTAPNAIGCQLIPPGNNIAPPGSNLAAPNGSADFTEMTQGSTCKIRSNIELGAPPNNRRLYIEVKSAAGKINQKGEWVIKLTNAGAAPLNYHAWITGSQFERFKDDLSPSFTVISPGSATGIITVGNYASSGKGKGKIADSSSRGPRLGDNLQKPDLSAPGVDICAAKRDFHEGCCCDCCCSSYIDNTGTSMAAPHVTGAIALMLQRNPALQHQDIKNILLANGRKDSYTGPNNNNDFGNGKLDVLALLNDPAVGRMGTVIASQRATARPRVVVRDGAERIAQEVPKLPQLQEGTPLWRLLNTAEGQKLYLRGRTHFEEVRALVNSHKRIATVWHRNHGPMLMHHVTRTVMLPHVPLPREWDGEELSIRAARLVSALEPCASKELIRALHETLPLIAQLQGKTLLEVVEMFEAEEVLEHA